jgi:hypothetical protein
MRHIGLGNHYLFCRAGAMQCLLRYLQAAPRLGLMALAYRYARPSVPMLRRIRAFWSKLVRRG